MKKVLTSIFAAAFLLLGTQAQAQLVPGAGYLHAIENTKNIQNNKADPVENMNGFYLGASYNIPIAGILGFAPGFYVDFLFQSVNNTDGASIHGVIISGTSSSNYTEVALNMPLNLTLKYDFSSNGSIFAFVGPVFQLGVMARSTYHGAVQIGPIHYSDGETFNHYDKEKGDTKPFNIFVGGGVGVQVGDIQFMAGYDYGVLNIDRVDGYYTGRQQIKAGINFSF